MGNFVINSGSDTRQPSPFTWKGGDVPNGFGLSTTELGGGVVYEGTPVGTVEGDTLYHVIKTASILSASGSVITVAKGHNFIAGDYLTTKVGGSVATISSIATNADDSSCDDITLSGSLDSTDEGTVVYESAESEGAFIYTPKALLGNTEFFRVGKDNNVITSGIIFGVVRESALKAPIGDELKTYLKHIEFV